MKACRMERIFKSNAFFMAMFILGMAVLGSVMYTSIGKIKNVKSAAHISNERELQNSINMFKMNAYDSQILKNMIKSGDNKDSIYTFRNDDNKYAYPIESSCSEEILSCDEEVDMISYFSMDEPYVKVMNLNGEGYSIEMCPGRIVVKGRRFYPILKVALSHKDNFSNMPCNALIYGILENNIKEIGSINNAKDDESKAVWYGKDDNLESYPVKMKTGIEYDVSSDTRIRLTGFKKVSIEGKNLGECLEVNGYSIYDKGKSGSMVDFFTSYYCRGWGLVYCEKKTVAIDRDTCSVVCGPLNIQWISCEKNEESYMLKGISDGIRVKCMNEILSRDP